MSPPRIAADLDPLVARFESAWQQGSPPRIEDFLPPAGDARRHAVVTELIKIDLERRWRGSAAMSRLRLEDYANRFPELGSVAEMSLELIAEEYWVRCMWGDKPSAGEYLARFASQGTKLRARLAKVDEEVARETATASNPTPTLPRAAVKPTLGNDAAPPVAALLDALCRLALLTPAQLAAVRGSHFPDPRALARDLLQRAWLTPLQANLLLQGRSADLQVGPYLLFEKVGQGGAGDVYKARHQHMERIVALKVIKKELVSDSEVMARFLREVKVISQLSHPNIVQAHDAGPHGSNYFLAMEYVEGTDLARLVKDKGPLPHVQARGYIQQAALGLQHIHERGLVHRDIKPSNLLVQSPDVVKILDLGLARLRQPSVSEAAGQVTGPGAMMLGTLDYMAPEQAIDFRSADIRADIYSLGCTLYFLLTGRPPFPDCTVAEKLLRHQQAEPAPVETVQTNLPADLGPILRRMMAKRPEDRFQTPGEVAHALAVPSATYLAAVIRSSPAVSVRVLPVTVSSRAVVLIGSEGRRAARPGLLSHLMPFLRTKRFVLGGGAALIALVLVAVLIGAFNSGPATVYLSDLPEIAVGPGVFGKDGTVRLKNTDTRISMGGKLAPKGLFLAPLERSTCYVRYRLGKRYSVLQTKVGFNDTSIGVPASITFTVVGDGKKLWESKPMINRGPPVDCEVSVEGIDLLELSVTCPGAIRFDDNWQAHGVWVDPIVKR